MYQVRLNAQGRQALLAVCSDSLQAYLHTCEQGLAGNLEDAVPIVRWRHSDHGGNLEFRLAERWYTIHSSIDPSKECTRLVATLKASDLFIVFGAGSLHYIAALHERFPQAQIMVFEPFKQVVRLLASTGFMPMSLHTTNSRIRIFETCPEELQYVLKAYNPLVHHTISIIDLPAYRQHFPDLSAVFRTSVSNHVHTKMNDVRTQSVFGRRWLTCMRENLNQYLDSPNAEPILHPPPQKMALIVGAGPGAELLPTLSKKYASSVDIFCADTSLRYCLLQGISPDFVGSVDAQQISLQHLVSLPILSRTTALLDLCAHPAYARYFKTTSWSFGGHPLLQLLSYLVSAGASKEAALFPLVQTGGNVGHFLVAQAIALGYQKIMAIGMDFRYGIATPYIQPSFLNTLFDSSATRLQPGENHWVKLYLGEEMKRDKNGIITPRLEDYETNFHGSFASTNEIIANKLVRTISHQHQAIVCAHRYPEKFQIISGLKLLLGLLEHNSICKETAGTFADGLTHALLTAVSPLLSSLQRQRLQCGENPADTINADLETAIKTHITWARSILKGRS